MMKEHNIEIPEKQIRVNKRKNFLFYVLVDVHYYLKKKHIPIQGLCFITGMTFTTIPALNYNMPFGEGTFDIY